MSEDKQFDPLEALRNGEIVESVVSGDQYKLKDNTILTKRSDEREFINNSLYYGYFIRWLFTDQLISHKPKELVFRNKEGDKIKAIGDKIYSLDADGNEWYLVSPDQNNRLFMEFFSGEWEKVDD